MVVNVFAAIAGCNNADADINNVADFSDKSDNGFNRTATSFCPCAYPEQFGRRYLRILFERSKWNDVISVYEGYYQRE